MEMSQPVTQNNEKDLIVKILDYLESITPVFGDYSGLDKYGQARLDGIYDTIKDIEYYITHTLVN